MTRDDIIRMAREANFYDSEIGGNEDGFVRFAALVAAAEREACAKVCEELELKSAEWLGFSEESVEWGTYVAGWSDGTDDCAAAIRARGDKP